MMRWRRPCVAIFGHAVNGAFTQRWAHATRRCLNTAQTQRHDERIQNIRNIGIIAHVDAGKTTTTERMLYHAGVITRQPGNVDQGSTVTDFLPMERDRGITIQSAAITLPWPSPENCKPGQEPAMINLIDTPGHQDFRFEVERCLPILDGAVCILEAVKGVETHTERVWNTAHEYKIPRILFVNKLDRDGASFKRSVQDVALKLRAVPAVCQIPWWERDNFFGVCDVVDMVGMSWSSTGKMTRYDVEQRDPVQWEEMQRARSRLVETLAGFDDVLMDEFARDDGEIPSSSIKESIRRVIRDGEARITPIFTGSSLQNAGVDSLLDAIKDYLPSPLDRPEVQVRYGPQEHGLSQVLEQQIQRKGRNPGQAPVVGIASVFKVMKDPKRGMLSFIRVYHGSIPRGAAVWNTNPDVQKLEKPLNILQVAADKTLERQVLGTGQIGALTGLKHSRTGDTLVVFAKGDGPEAMRSIRIRPPEIPPAVAFNQIEAYSLTDMAALEESLESLSREDPSIRWSKDEKTDLFTMSGMGKLHLEVAEDRLKSVYKAPGEFKEVVVEYKECLTTPTPPYRAVYERDIAGRTGKAACTVALEPIEAHHHDSLPKPSVEREGNVIHVNIPQADGKEAAKIDFDLVREQLQNGAIAALARGVRRGSPVHNCYVSITYDPQVDYFGSLSSGHIANAARNAIRGALKEAHQRHEVGIYEPFILARIWLPEEAAGAIQHDITSARGGQVLEVRDGESSEAATSEIDLSDVYTPPDPYESVQSLRASKSGIARQLQMVVRAPLKEMLDYDSLLRGKTGGRHSLSWQLDTFERLSGPREKALDSM